MRTLILVLVVAFAIVTVWIAFANARLDVAFSPGIGAPVTTSLAKVLFGTVVATVLFTGSLAVLEGLALRLDNRRLRKQLKALEEEIHDLRNLGLQGSETLGPAHASATQAHPVVRIVDDET